jgi:hypothetical protein
MENKYQNGKIYKVINTITNKIYIGSTVRRICERMGQHRRNANNINKNSTFYNYMREVGIEHFKIILIKLYPCMSNDELEAEEFKEISIMNMELLLNDSIVYKKKSNNHIKKVADANRGDKSVLFKFGSIFRREFKTKEDYNMVAWCFSYQNGNKQSRCQYSVKKYGEEEARQLALQKQREIYPNINII